MLLDTCTLIWLTSDQDRLSPVAREAIDVNRENLFVCAVSAFELALKHTIGKLDLGLPPLEWYEAVLSHHGLVEIPIDGTCASLAGRLPLIHRDPCDRFLIAAAQVHNLPILTPDPWISRYPDVRVVW